MAKINYESDNIRKLKITAVGDPMVGKTSLLCSYSFHAFPGDYIPAIFEHYGRNITVDDQEYDLALYDTAGQDDYYRLRPLGYPNTVCFLICYSVSSRKSYENVLTNWVPEVRHNLPSTPIILVGTKIDLREDPDLKTISTKEGKKLMKKIGADAFFECSALKFQGLNEIFSETVRCSISPKKEPKKHECQML